MNNDRRKRLRKSIERIELSRHEIKEIGDEEITSFENLPEGLQESEKGIKLEENHTELDSIDMELEELKDRILDIIES